MFLAEINIENTNKNVFYLYFINQINVLVANTPETLLKTGNTLAKRKVLLSAVTNEDNYQGWGLFDRCLSPNVRMFI